MGSKSSKNIKRKKEQQSDKQTPVHLDFAPKKFENDISISLSKRNFLLLKYDLDQLDYTYDDFISTNAFSLVKNDYDSRSKTDDLSKIIRAKYLCKLESKGLFNNTINKTISNITIFDWDDTLMFTYDFFTRVSENEKLSRNIIRYFTINTSNQTLSPSLISKSNTRLSLEEVVLFKGFFYSKLKYINELQSKIFSLLQKAIELSDVFIVSNASFNWIEFSAQIFFPDVYNKIFPKIKIVSNRDIYEHIHTPDIWKNKSFNEIALFYRDSSIVNLIIIGDNELEIEAGKHMIKQFKNPDSVYLKTVKLKQKPSLNLLKTQISLLKDQFHGIHKRIKSVSITLSNNKDNSKTESTILLRNKNNQSQVRKNEQTHI